MKVQVKVVIPRLPKLAESGEGSPARAAVPVPLTTRAMGEADTLFSVAKGPPEATPFSTVMATWKTSPVFSDVGLAVKEVMTG